MQSSARRSGRGFGAAGKRLPRRELLARCLAGGAGRSGSEGISWFEAGNDPSMNKLSDIIGLLSGGWLARPAPGDSCLFRVRIATKLVWSFLLIILLTSGVLSMVGVQVIGNRIVAVMSAIADAQKTEPALAAK